MAKYTSPYSGERIDHSVKAIPDTNPEEESILVISSDGEGSYKKVSEVGATVVQETGDSETQVMSQKAVTNALGTKADKQSVEGMISDLVVQETGQATDKVMSQKIVTDSLNGKINYTDINNGLKVVDGKVNANIAKIQDSTSTEFSPDENGVVTIPNGGASKKGLWKLTDGGGYFGLQDYGGGQLAIHPADKALIDGRAHSTTGDGNKSPIIPGIINYAVKAALTDDKRIGTETTDPTTFTDTEKDRACEVIGANRKLYRHNLRYSFLDFGGQRHAGNVVFISLNSKQYAENGEESLSALRDVISVEQWNPESGTGGYSYYPAYFYTDVSGDYYLAAIGVANVARLLLSADYSYDTFQDVVTKL